MNSPKTSLKSSVSSVHKIASNISNDSTVLRSLQDKVSENLKLKEKINDLEMHLKVEIESNKLQSAEFAFREQEYVEEIEALKNNLEQFRKGITTVETSRKHYYEVDVLLQTEKEKVAKLTEKLSKWKARTKSFIDQIEIMKAQINQLQAENDQIKGEFQNLQEENKKLSLDNQHKDKYFEDQMILIKQNWQKELDAKDNFIESIKEEANENKMKLLEHIEDLKRQNKDNNEKWKTQLNQMKENEIELKAEVADLRNDNDRYQAQINDLRPKLKEIEQKLLKANEISKHNDIEKDILLKLLDINPSIEGTEWNLIHEKIKELINKLCNIESLANENELLKNRMNFVTNEIKRQKETQSNISDKKQDINELIKTLQFSLKQTKDELEKAQNLISHLKLKLKFAKMIDQQQVPVLKAVSSFHASVFQTDQSNLRGIILALIFVKRFPTISNNDGEIDLHSLFIYRGRSLSSYDKKIRDLKQKMADLEHDIMFMKQSIEDAQYEANKISQEKAKLEQGLKPEKEKEVFNLKQQINKLSTELAQHISPDLYNKVCNNLKKVEEVNRSLKDEVNKLSSLLERRNDRYHQLKLGFKEYILSSEHQIKNYNSLKAKYEEQQSKIHDLNVLLNERTKEILALERLNNRQSAIAKSSIKCCSNFAAENESMNNIIQGTYDGYYESPKCKELRGKGLLCSINPVFLGTNDCYLNA